MGAGPLEPRLRDLLASPPDWLRDFVPLYAALSHGEDASLADLFRSSYDAQRTPRDRLSQCASFYLQPASRLKNLLLGMLRRVMSPKSESAALAYWKAGEQSTQHSFCLSASAG